MKRTRGFTLPELMVSMLTFGMVTGMVFLLFGISSRGFRTIEARQSAQNQLAAVRAALQRDIQVTHFYGIFHRSGPTRRVDGKEYRRDGFSAVALEDWDSPTSVNAYGVAAWDRWAVYRVTNEDRGQLLRHLASPRTGARGRSLLREADGLANYLLSAEVMNASWSRISPPSVLARGVRAFEIRKHDRQRAVSVDLTIEQATDPKNPRPDVLTASFYIKPHNTVPVD